MGRKRHAANRRKPTRGQRRPSLTGTVRLTEAGGAVETAEGTFRLAGRSLREVMAGDTVAISTHRGNRGERRAVVEGVIERAATTVVGTFAPAGPLGCVRPLDTRLKADFFVLPRDRSAQELGVREGDVVSARIESYPSRYESGVVTIERRLGDADAPDLGIRCIMARYDLEDGYPEPALRAAEGLALDIEGALADPLRRDVRDAFALTIDPVDARDFDDAISIARRADGGFDLMVHIADVSHYVAWEDVIDLEARRRATSVYLADRVLPMLPERLSCDLCSLRPGEDRLAFTVAMRFDRRGRLRGGEAFPSAMRSRVRLSYDQADAVLEGDASLAAEELRAAAAAGVDLGAFLADAAELARLRRRLRFERGAVDFDTVEVHALLDEEGEPYELVSRHRTEATGLIEEAMLAANEFVAEWLSARDIVCAYRVHDRPSPDHLHDAAATLAELGIVSRQEAAEISLGSQAAMRAVLARAAGTPSAELVNALLLRAMQRAVYRPENAGHYALAASAYCHFTSPIRRYPDLLVHRALKVALARERLGERAARERVRALTGQGLECLERIAPALCRASSDRERIADAAGRASQKVEVARYFSRRVGERLRGTVTWVDQLGAFVRLEGSEAEGLIHVRDLGDEWFELDERALTYTGAATGRTVRPGDRVIVEVRRCDVLRGHLDLALVAGPRTLH